MERRATCQSVRALDFHLFTGSVAVSHAYAHLVDFGEPVEIGGLKISPGDLLQGDRHGVQSIPVDHIPEIAEEAARIQCAERDLIEFCRSRRFSLPGLAEKLKEVAKDCL
jgi:4-hydroxy-4-methyl-2-oxoglutarate aldolase